MLLRLWALCRTIGVARHFFVGLGKPLEHGAEIRPDGFLRTQTRLRRTLAINSRVFFHHTDHCPHDAATFRSVRCDVNVTHRLSTDGPRGYCVAVATSDLI